MVQKVRRGGKGKERKGREGEGRGQETGVWLWCPSVEETGVWQCRALEALAFGTVVLQTWGCLVEVVCYGCR